MASNRKKLQCDVSVDDPVSSESESELDDEFNLEFSGHLTLRGTGIDELEDEDSSDDEPNGCAPVPKDVMNSRERTGSVHSHQDGEKKLKFHPGRTVFEVVSAKTMKDGHKKFVLYTVAVLRTRGADTSQATVERRYSDFYHLNQNLRKSFPEIMENVEFPRKVMTGNFKHGFIAERSRAFEQFLSHVFDVEAIRTSDDFQDFFYNRDLRLAYRYMSDGNFQEAVPYLQNALHLQEKMIGDTHPDTIRTLCALIVAYTSLEDCESHAHEYAEAALKNIGEDRTNPFLIPLLQNLIGIRWRLQKDKRELECWLSRVKLHVGDGPLEMPTLEDLVMQCLSHI